jgi:hypothetical protein
MIPLPLLALMASSVAIGDGVSEPAPWIRSAQSTADGSVLQIASRRYVGADEVDLPDVWLVGVTHIGSLEYYEGLVDLLSGCDIVLYESVMPEGARVPRGDDDMQRIQSTQASLELLSRSATHCVQAGQPLPGTVESLRQGVIEMDLRLGGWIDNASVDAWGRPVRFEHDEAEATLRIISTGPDGQPGTADDLSSDLSVVVNSEAVVEGNVNLQAMLAKSLGLRFQLDTMPYDDTRWRVSDMSVEAVKASFEARGMDFDDLGDTLAGTSMPAQLIKTMLAIIPMGDALSGGSVSDAIKVVMIELLGTPGLLNLMDQQYGVGFNEVIINERNGVPLEDLRRLIDDEPEVDCIAILYGAAHMSDMSLRLEAEQHGYVIAETRWDDAISVDQSKSNLTESDFKSIRRSIRVSLASVKRAARQAREAAEAAGAED